MKYECAALLELRDKSIIGENFFSPYRFVCHKSDIPLPEIEIGPLQ